MVLHLDDYPATLEVALSATLAVLHEALLACFGWSGECLHEFTIRAAGYSSEGLVDAIDTRTVTLGSLGLRVGERFTWRYDLAAGWIIDLCASRRSPRPSQGHW